MTGTTYLAAPVVAQLDRAQRLLDAHVTVLPDGACRLYGITESCEYRAVAHATFARYRRLPQRRPGASRPELMGARRVSWLT
jgi:hypothetical protein